MIKMEIKIKIKIVKIIIIITIIQYSMFGDALWWVLSQQFIAIVVGPRYNASNHLYPQLHFTLSLSLKTTIF